MKSKRSVGIWAFFVCVATASAASAGESVRISKWDAAPVFEGDGWEFKISGRVQEDYSIIDADRSGADWDASELRRLRLGVSGKFGDALKYKVEVNIDGEGEVDLQDAYVQWAPGGKDWDLTAGQFRTPNSLDGQTSSRFTSTLERAAFTSAFEFDRRLGFAVGASGDRYGISVGVFGDNLNQTGNEDGYAIAARATFNPVKSDALLVHLGGSMRYREIGDSQGDIRYRQRPFAHIPGRIISTGSIADSDMFVGAEAAAIAGKIWMAGEYGATFADCSAAAAASGACLDDPTLDGGYAEAGIFFGGKKGYKGGKFDRPHVNNPVTKGGMGALALVARFDTISLTDSDVDGGGYDAYILGADWWATKYTRLGVNFFKVDANLGEPTSGLDSNFAALVTAGAPAEDVKGVMFRAQLDL